jgi:hypothetical protein
MSRMKLAVCLLALAGSATLFLYSRGTLHRSHAPIAASRLLSGKRPASWFSLPITFEPNVGQASSGVQFIGRGKGMSVFLRDEEIAIALPKRAAASGGGIDPLVEIRLVRASASSSRKTRLYSHRRRTRGKTTRSHPRRKRPRAHRGTTLRTGQVPSRFAWRGEGQLAGRSNYFIGRNRREWRTHVPHYAGADAAEALPGVGMTIYGNGEGVEYDLRLRPGVNAAELRLTFAGTDETQLAANGDLVLRAGENELRMKKPAIYEELPEAAASAKEGGLQQSVARTHVEGGYVLEADGSVGFAIGPHDANASLVIDPSLSVSYATFLGGAGSDAANSIALDSSGNVYIGGTTSLGAFGEPTTATIGPGIGTSGGSGGNSGASSNTGTEYFVAKINLNASGASSLVYLTFIGGSISQSGGLIAVDASGNAAVTGTTTSPDFPVTDGSTLTSGSNDATVSEIDPTGSTLLFSTLFGGSGAESQYNPGGIAVDAQGQIYIASDTSSQDLPVTTGAFQPAFAGGSSDGFLAIFQPSASPSLTYCSYLGTNASAEVGVGGIAVDASGNAYIAGFTSNAQNGFPTKNALQTAYGGDPSDAFLMMIFPGGQGAADVIYATLLGGSGLDEALAVAVDNSIPANAYVTGTTQSANFPTNGVVAPYQSHLHVNATANAFLSVVAQNPATGMTSLAYSTYLGGSATDAGQGVTATAFNSVYITGAAKSWDFPWHDNLQPFNGSSDGFVAKLDPSAAGAASLIYATPLGGTAPPGLTVAASASAIAADGFGDVYAAGQTTAADFPTAVTTGGVMNGFQPICASCQAYPAAADAFLIALQESAAPQPSVYFNIGSVIFPAQPIGTQNAPQPVAVHNGGEAALTISSLQITGPNSQDFSLIGPGACKGQTIATGGECSFEVGFVPTTTGPEEAVVSFSDNAPGNPQVLELIGAGQGAFAVLSTTSINFGSQPENTSSLSLPITVTNTGNQALALQSPVESGPDVAQFFLEGKDITCGTTLAAGASCSIGVVFSPKAIGTFHAQITITDNSGGVTNAIQVVSLTGTATSVAPVASVTPATLAFGDIVAGTSSGAQQVNISSAGSAALSITNIAITGANAADFAFVSSGANPCPTSGSLLAIGASCAVGVRFAPATGDSSGAKSAVLSIADNVTGSPQTVTLNGVATIPPTIQISPASVAFAPQSVGIPSPAQTLTLLNGGGGPLSINGISITGTNAADFSQTSNCPPSLGAAASCAVSVVFSPASRASANRAASISIADNAAGSPQIVPVTGSATQPGISISPASINFGGQLAGTAGQPQTITVTNTGTGALAFNAIAVSGGADFVLGTNTCTGANISPNGTCTVQVSFSPACTNGTAARSASLALTDNVAGSPQSVPLSGTASGDFCFDPSTAATVTAGQTAVYSLVVNSPTAYKGSVSLACAGTPATTSCTLPASVAVPSQFTLSVATAASSIATPSSRRAPNVPKQRTWMTGAWGLLFVLWMLAALRREPKRATMIRGNLTWMVPWMALALFASSLWIAGCGGGSGAGSDPPVSGTPAGTYSLVLTGTSTNTTAQVTLTLTVQ